jgi:hypothetical protein
MAALGIVGVVLSACSSTDDFFGGRPPPPTGGGNSASFGDRFRNLFGSGSDAASAVMTPSPGATIEVDCPRVDIRQGASTLMMNASGEPSALGLRYQATFGRTARECVASAGTLSIKVGVQGRVILGPAGAPGETSIPLRYALVREGVEPKTVWSKLYIVPVTIGAGQPNVPFTHVEEALTVPLPSGAELDNYVIYVGFDPQGMAAEKKPEKKPPPKPRAQRAG